MPKTAIATQEDRNLTVPAYSTLFDPFQSLFDEFYNDFFQGWRNKNGLLKVKSKVDYPKLDCFYRGDKFIIEVEVPGLKKEDIKVELVSEDILKISGQKAEEYCDKDKLNSYQVKELRRSRFERFINLPEELYGLEETPMPETILKNGMLTLTWKVDQKQGKYQTRKEIPIKEE